MATVTHAGTAIWTTTAGNKTFTGTPVAGDLIVVVAATSGLTGGTTAVTDNNADGLGTYTQVDSDRTGFSTTGALTVWVRNALVGSATSTVFTAAQAGSSGGGLDVFRVSSMTRTGAAAVRQSAGQSAGTSGTTPAPVMGVAVLTGNPVIGAVCNGTSPATMTARASYTEATDLGYSTPTTGMETIFRSSGETGTTLTWGGTSASAFASVAVELDTSAPETSPQLEASGFGTFTGVSSGDTINSVTATINQWQSSASMGAPTYQLWDGTTGPVGGVVIRGTVQAGANITAVQASYTPGVPAGTQAGDLLILSCAWSGSTVTCGDPTGWTLQNNTLQTNDNLKVWTRTADGSANDTPTLVLSTGAMAIASCIALGNWTGTPVFANALGGSSSTTITFPAISPASSSDLLIYITGIRDATTGNQETAGAPAGGSGSPVVKQVDGCTNATSSANMEQAVFTQYLASASAIGQQTATVADSSSSNIEAICVQPATTETQAGTVSTSTSNTDSPSWTGVTFSQLSTLRLRITAHQGSAVSGATQSVDWAALTVNYTPASGGVTGTAAAVAVASGAGSPSGGASVTGTGAAITSAAGLGTPSGGSGVSGAGAQAAVSAGAGSLSAGQNLTGTGAQVAVAGRPGTPSGGASVSGVGAQATASAGAGSPAGGGGVAGVGSAVAVAAGTGSPSGSASVAGVGAQATVAAGLGTPSSGSSANVTGVGAQLSAAAGTGSPSGSASVSGTGAQVTAAAGHGTPSGGATATGIGAQVTTAAGHGTLSAGVAVTGVGAQVTVAAGAGVPSAGGAINISGVGAAVSVTAGIGAPSAGSSVTGTGARATVAAGTGVPSGSANVAGTGARVAVAAGTGTPSAGGSANVAGIGARVTTAAGVGSLAAAANVQGVAALQTLAGGRGTPASGASVAGVAAVLMVAAGAGNPGKPPTAVECSANLAFQARSLADAQATMEFRAGQPKQAGTVTLASDAWISTSPDIR